jgi:opacity protein-like surface antigen
MRILTSIALLVCAGTVSAQFNTKYEYLSMNPAVGVGIGSTNYFGELNRVEEFSAAKTSTFGAHLFYSHPISPSVFAKASVNFNKISHWGIDSSKVHNFSTQMYGGDIGAFYRLDNDIVFDQQKPLTVFIGGGIGFAAFKAKEDLISESGANYHYWSDGTIRDLNEDDINAETAVKIARDYDYETEIATAKSAFPYVYLEGGFGLKITHNLTANLSYKHSISFTDEIDGITTDNKKDRFDYFNISMAWSFGSPYRTADEILRDKEAETIDMSDLDEDGVTDLYDLCAKTPYGWEVDREGCPLDTDGDRVPDKMDKEPNTAKGATVNEEGVTLTDEEIEVLYLLQTGQIGGHEKFDEWKTKYPKMFDKYYNGSATSTNQSESEE